MAHLEVEGVEGHAETEKPGEGPEDDLADRPQEREPRIAPRLALVALEPFDALAAEFVGEGHRRKRRQLDQSARGRVNCSAPDGHLRTCASTSSAVAA